MFPDTAFIITLALRMAVTAAFLVTAAAITERAGAALGAIIATLPISAGPSYIFLAMDHDAAFISQSALASIPMSAATVFYALAYIYVAQRAGMVVSLLCALAAWLVCAVLIRQAMWSLTGGIVFNVVAFGVCLPLVQRFRHAKMPLITPRWYDMPMRAVLVATLVAVVVTLSDRVGPTISGILALFPMVFTSLAIILHLRVGGPATAAVIATGLFGMIGFTLAVIALHLAALPFGSAVALSLGLAVAMAWNFGWWALRRMRAQPLKPS